MSSATPEQREAIDKEGKNIIVSAGAGSGKTFVLKERVLREVKNGTSVDKLIILTFTKNAAQEMKQRIRKIINSEPTLKEESAKIDSAYITTFDSFSSSLVKKYNYLLGIPKSFGIIDTNIVNTEITKELDEIMDNYYANPTPEFDEFINNNCYKNDTEIKKSIIRIYNILGNYINKKEFLNTYIEKHFTSEYINSLLDEYTNLVFEKVAEMYPYYEQLIDLSEEEKHFENNSACFNTLQSATTLDELNEALSMKLSITKDESYKEVRQIISEKQKEIKPLITYSESELKTQYLSTKNTIKIIIDILLELDRRITNFKNEHNSYEFSDIAFKAIELVRDYPEVREEIKNNIHEIMIDEYQDTNDIQETFISYIANNNVYMVGDVKQSIYRFRNANPYIFKNKYDTYKDGIEGYKIDLPDNFRSRGEVVSNLNDFFSNIMTDAVGGAKYKEEHQMRHGAKDYDTLVTSNYDYNMKLINYKLDGTNYRSDEVEAHIIAQDILKKMNSNLYGIHEEKGAKCQHPLTYSDMAILVDKSTNFELLKKTLESYGIPSIIEKDVSLKEDDEIFILKNLINLLIHIKNKNFDIEFKHSYMSIARSYICKMSDEELFKIFVQGSDVKETELYKKIESLTDIVDSMSNKDIITTLINEFDIINKLTNVSDISDRMMRLEYFLNQADNLNQFGLDIYDLHEYFDEILTSDNDIKARGMSISSNAVTIMTIHGSKGLEYNYVYLPYLASPFKTTKDTPRYNLTNKFGFIVPFYDEGIDNTFIYKLNTENEKSEIISEKIRLLYVAITRAKEQFIMINELPKKEITQTTFTEDILKKTTSFSDIINKQKSFFAPYTEEIDVTTLEIENETNTTANNYKEMIPTSNEQIKTNPIVIENTKLESKHFSKSLKDIMTKETRNKLDLGTDLHYLFEIYDFNNSNINEYNEKDRTYIENFLKHDEVSNISESKCYKEYEFMDVKDDSTYQGIIDLLVEYTDHFDIIDYKTSDTDSPEYIKQLQGYKNYIENKFNKPTNIYLYSIFKDEFKSIK